MKKANSSSGKLFWITFLSAVIVFLILFGIFYYVTLNDDTRVDTPLTGITIPQFTAADSLYFLFLYDGELDGSDLYAAVISCNTATGTVTDCELDLRIETLINDSRNSLYQQYRLRGMQGLLSGCENLLQTNLDAYIRCDKTGIKAAAQTFGGVELKSGDLTELITDGIANPRSFAKSFEIPAQRGILLHRLIQTAFTDANTLTQTKNLLFRQMETNFTAYDALDHKQAMESLTAAKNFTRMTLSAKAVQLGEKTVYIPDTEQLSALKAAMNR